MQFQISKRRGVFWSTVAALMVLIVEWIIGTYINIDGPVIVTYIIYLIALYSFDAGLIVEYSCIILLISLNVFGVYLCDSAPLFLPELFQTSHYACALSPLVICYILFLFTVEQVRIKTYRHEKKIQQTTDKRIEKNNKLLLRVISMFGILLAGGLFLSRIDKPYFLYKVTRQIYASSYMTPLELSLKSYLIMFAPVVLIYSKITKKNIYSILFFLFVFAYYIWTGDKFGTHFLMTYIILVSMAINISEKSQKRFTIVVAVAFGLLLAIVFSQQYLMNGTDSDLFSLYLSERGAQQGQIWWSVYEQNKGRSSHINDFWQELSVVLPIKYDGLVGQWKMMVESSSNEIVRMRAIGGNAYSDTTPASLYYYFKYPGMLFFYFLSGIIYPKIVSGLSLAFKNYRVIEAVLLVRILTLFHNLFTASDLYIVSWKGLLYILLLVFVVYLRKQNKHIVVGKRRTI